MPSPMHWCLLSNRKSCQTGSLSSYDKPSVSGFIHHHFNHSKALADYQNHINGIENFGIRQNASCENTTESIANLSRCSWKNANFDLTSAHHPGSFKPSGIGVEFRANYVSPFDFQYRYGLRLLRNILVTGTAALRRLTFVLAWRGCILGRLKVFQTTFMQVGFST